MSFLRAIVAAVAVLVSACSSNFQVERVSMKKEASSAEKKERSPSETKDPSASEKKELSPSEKREPSPSELCRTDGDTAGIPFRVPATYTIRVYQLHGMRYEAVDSPPFIHTLPDPCELFSLSFSAKAFSDQKVALKYRDDGTLDTLDLVEAKKLAEAIDSVGGQALDLYAAYERRDLTELEAKKAGLVSKKEALETEQALATAMDKPATDKANQSGAAMIGALESMNAARAAERALANAASLQANASALASLEDALRLARLKANDAYRKAGLDAPFLDVFP